MCKKVLFSARLNHSHKRSSGSRRYICGKLCTQRPWEVKIVRYDNDQEVYLIEYDEDHEEIIDSFHSGVREAMIQAEFDWGIKGSDWTLSVYATQSH
ncbi:MAG: hypothetical protein ACX93T_03310 [Bacteroidota bacterium]